jgi:hypothetical protein
MRLHRIALDTLAVSRVLWLAGMTAPRFFSGRLLHQAALWAAWEGAYPEADRLFEAAAGRYQVGFHVVPLARLRVHQAMARARAPGPDAHAGERHLDVERRLCRLERIEAPWPPFPLVDAPSLLATWLDDQAALIGDAIPGGGGHTHGHALDRAA